MIDNIEYGVGMEGFSSNSPRQTNPINVDIDLMNDTNNASNLTGFEALDNLKPQDQEVHFDWDRSGADRFVHPGDNKYEAFGFDPRIGGLNEQKYAEAQTWGDVAANAFVGHGKLFAHSFAGGVKSWYNLGNALFNWGSDKSFKERLIGSPEEMLEDAEETKKIFNDNAIYHLEGENPIFNKGFLGDMVMNAGFATGIIAETILESVITAGAAEFIKGALLPKTIAQAANAIGKTVTTDEKIKDLKSMMDLFWKDPKRFSNLGKGFDNFGSKLPVFGELYDGGKKLAALKSAKAGALEMAFSGAGAIKRSLSEFNMAASESMMEASGLYGEVYNNLTEKYIQTHNGNRPQGEDLEKIKTNAENAARDNYAVNLVTIATMNKIEWGNLMSKFSSDSKQFKNIAEIADKTFEVKKDGITQLYKTGRFGRFSALSQISAEMGKKKALWEGTKAIAKGALGKFELAEGAQELIQETSSNSLEDYYTRLYNGKDSDIYNSVTKGASDQWSKEGLKTFVMGAATGMLISPLHMSLQAGTEAIKYGGNQEYKDAKKAAEADLENNIAVFNAASKNVNLILSPIVANIKQQMEASDGMYMSALNKDIYSYNNWKTESMIALVDAAEKLNRLDSVIDTFEAYGATMTTPEFIQAFNIKSKDTKLTKSEAFAKGVSPSDEFSHKEFINNVTKSIINYKKLKDELSDDYEDNIDLSKYEKDSEEYNIALLTKRARVEAIDMLAGAKFKSWQSAERAVEVLSEAAQTPIIGDSLYRSFSILGTPEYLDKEIYILNEEINTMSNDTELDTDLKRNLEFKKGQLQLLNDWKNYFPVGSKNWVEFFKAVKENTAIPTAVSNQVYTKLYKTFTDYIKNYEEASDNPTPQIYDVRDFDKGFKAMIDHVQLTKDHQDYLEAFNILANPKEFALTHGKISRALLKAHANLMTQVITNATKQEAPTSTVTNVTKPVVDEEQVKSEAERKRKLEEQKDSLKILISQFKRDIENYNTELKKIKTEEDRVNELISEYQKQIDEFKINLAAQSLPENIDDINKAIENIELLIKEASDHLNKLKEVSEKYNTAIVNLNSNIAFYTNMLAQISDVSVKEAIDIDQRKDNVTNQKEKTYTDLLKTYLLSTEEAQKIVKDNIDKTIKLIDELESFHASLSAFKEILNKIKAEKTLEGRKKVISQLYVQYKDSKKPEEKELVKTLAEYHKSIESKENEVLYNAMFDVMKSKEFEQYLNENAEYLDFQSLLDTLDDLERGLIEGKKLLEEYLKKFNDPNEDVVDFDRKPEYKTRIDFTLENLFLGVGRHFHPAHYNIEGTFGNYPNVRIGKNENGSLYILDKAKYDQATIQTILKIMDHIASKEYQDNPTPITVNNEVYNPEFFENDVVVNEQDRVADSYLFSSNAIAKPTDRFIVVTKNNIQNYPYIKLNNDAFDDDIKVVFANEKGQPLNKNREVIDLVKNPTEVLYWSLRGDEVLLRSSDEKEIISKIYNTFTVGKNETKESIINKVNQYRIGRDVIVKKVADNPNTPMLLNITGKTKGVPFLDITNNEDGSKTYHMHPLSGRVIKSNTNNWTLLYHPNGQKISLEVNSFGKLYAVREDTTVFPITNRKLEDAEKETVLNALKMLSRFDKGVKSAETERLKEILKNLIFYGNPKDPKNPGANRIWIEKGYIKKSFYNDKNEIEIVSYLFHENMIEEHKETLLNGMYHNVIAKNLKSNEEFKTSDVKYDEKSDTYTIVPVKTWKHYNEYLLSDNDRTPVVNTAVIPWNKDQPQVKQVDFYYDYSKLVPKSDPKPKSTSTTNQKSAPTQPSPTSNLDNSKIVHNFVMKSIIDEYLIVAKKDKAPSGFRIKPLVETLKNITLAKYDIKEGTKEHIELSDAFEIFKKSSDPFEGESFIFINPNDKENENTSLEFEYDNVNNTLTVYNFYLNTTKGTTISAEKIVFNTSPNKDINKVTIESVASGVLKIEGDKVDPKVLAANEELNKNIVVEEEEDDDEFVDEEMMNYPDLGMRVNKISENQFELSIPKYASEISKITEPLNDEDKRQSDLKPNILYRRYTSAKSANEALKTVVSKLFPNFKERTVDQNNKLDELLKNKNLLKKEVDKDYDFEFDVNFTEHLPQSIIISTLQNTTSYEHFLNSIFSKAYESLTKDELSKGVIPQPLKDAKGNTYIKDVDSFYKKLDDGTKRLNVEKASDVFPEETYLKVRNEYLNYLFDLEADYHEKSADILFSDEKDKEAYVKEKLKEYLINSTLTIKERLAYNPATNKYYKQEETHVISKFPSEKPQEFPGGNYKEEIEKFVDDYLNSFNEPENKLDIESQKADIEKRRQEELFGNLTPLTFEKIVSKGKKIKTSIKTKIDKDGFNYSFETILVDSGETVSPIYPKVSLEEFKNSSIYKNLDLANKEIIDALSNDSVISLQSIDISTDKNSAAGLGNGNITISVIDPEFGASGEIILKYQPNKINAKYDAELEALENKLSEGERKIKEIQDLIDQIPEIEQKDIQNDNTVKLINAIFAINDLPLITEYSNEVDKEARELTNMSFNFTYTNLKHAKEEIQKYFNRIKDDILKSYNKTPIVNKPVNNQSTSDIDKQKDEIIKQSKVELSNIRPVYHHTSVAPEDFNFSTFKKGKDQISQFGDGLNASSTTTSFLTKRYGKPIQGEVNDADFVKIDASKTEKEVYDDLKAQGYQFAEKHNSSDILSDSPGAAMDLFTDFQKSNPNVKGVKVSNHILGNTKIDPFYVIYTAKAFYGQDSLKKQIDKNTIDKLAALKETTDEEETTLTPEPVNPIENITNTMNDQNNITVKGDVINNELSEDDFINVISDDPTVSSNTNPEITNGDNYDDIDLSEYKKDCE